MDLVIFLLLFLVVLAGLILVRSDQRPLPRKSNRPPHWR